MIIRKFLFHFHIFVACAIGFTAEKETIPVRIGYFSNLTHAQALYGISQKKFSAALGEKTKLTTLEFNAGPSIIEAIFSDSLDIAYVGPSPAINAFIKSRGKAIRIVSGAASGGVRLIVHPNAKIKSAKDFTGKSIATPQLGNTQDVAARTWLKAQGLKIKDVSGNGDVGILPLKNSDQLGLFIKGDIQASWAVEPWASRLVAEGGGTEFLNEKTLWPNQKFATTVVIVRQEFLRQHPEVVRNFLTAHREITAFAREHTQEFQKIVDAAIEKNTGKSLPPAVSASAWREITFTTDPLIDSIRISAHAAFALGYLGAREPNLEGITDLTYLESAPSPSVEKKKK